MLNLITDYLTNANIGQILPTKKLLLKTWNVKVYYFSKKLNLTLLLFFRWKEKRFAARKHHKIQNKKFIQICFHLQKFFILLFHFKSLALDWLKQ